MTQEINSKSQALNSKQILILKFQIPNRLVWKIGIWKIRICLGFRISNLRFDFSVFLLFVLIILFLRIPVFVVKAKAEEQTMTVEYTSGNLRDPFENLLVKGIEKSRMLAEPEGIREEEAISEINLPQLSLQGLIWDAPIPQAIIDDKIVKIGDKLKDAEVLDIKKEGVILLFQNKKFIIKPTKGGE